MTTALIIDDEQSASDVLQLMIERFVPQIERSFVCNDARQAASMIHKLQPDLLFLDIRMPFFNGFEVLEQVKHKPFKIIFTTAYDEYAIQAIRFSAFDYLLKPVDAQDLIQAAERFMATRNDVAHQPAQLKNALSNMQANHPEQFHLALPSRDGMYFLTPPEIVRCEALGSYTKFYATGNRSYITSKSIGEYEDLLAPQGFVRTHKSHIVNKIFVSYLDHEGFIVLKDHSKVEVSRRRKDEVVNRLK